MKEMPAFFDPIRLKAAQRWDQLEQDPELAGPWHQLFMQVQSPRHVVSELLQNADDAGATEASVRIDDGHFVFEHNGGDFTEEHFASLCRFGYSNKRALHTIGFRGIGFKSTFSLGDSVELFTPTLAITFHRTRFTEPRWLSEDVETDGWTRVRVAIRDQHRQDEVSKNLEEWLKSPLSLLFFRTIRLVQIGGRTLHWQSRRPGPIPDSEWMALDEQEDGEILVLRSDEEAFPDEALAEIKEERLLRVEDTGEFPPCRIELALGAKGGLFAVLPTGVDTGLPFACNAPFIPDPARLKIKDPGTSSTNRWLLHRAGELAGSAMLRWLEDPSLPTAGRARAYELLPNVNWDDNSPGGVAGTIVEKAFKEVIAGQPVLLTNRGELTREKGSIIIPSAVAEIWPADQAAALLDESGRPSLSHDVRASDRKKLLNWRLVEEIDKTKFLTIVASKDLPRPETWRHLLRLWAYIAPAVTSYPRTASAKDVRIVPVEGSEVLHAAAEVVRLGDKKMLHSDDDWEFLAPHLSVLDQGWTRFLAEERQPAEDGGGASAGPTVDAAFAVLDRMGLANASDVSKVIDLVAAKFLSERKTSVRAYVQLAQVAATLNAQVGPAFRYVTSDRCLRSIDPSILFDDDGTLEDLLPEELRKTRLLHPDYGARYSSCSREAWLQWASSGRARLFGFVPLVQTTAWIYGRKKVEQVARDRGVKNGVAFHYITDDFVLRDWDFDEVNWRHWMSLAANDDRLWTKIADRVLSQRADYWKPAGSARLGHVATTGNWKQVTYEALLPQWAIRLRNVPCLRDTRGFHREPGDLLRRTPETEPLLDVEPFIDARIDTEAARPLLDLLGVRSTPAGPDAFLERLRALAKSEKPPVNEVDKWYRRLDRLVETCSTADLAKIRQAFGSEKLILTQDGAWGAASGVFLSSDEDVVPGAATVRSAVSDLTLWRKIDVAERPTADLALSWLSALPSGQALAPEDARRVRALLGRHPTRIWDECGHWLNLAGAWVPVDGLEYALTMQSLVPWAHLFPWVKDKTAELRDLRAEDTGNPPFSRLHALAQKVEERLDPTLQLAGRPEKREWLASLGAGLCRAQFDTDEETRRIGAVAARLARTSWRTAAGLTITPYIDGTPAGVPRQVDVLWHDVTLYVDHLPMAKLARRVPEEVGKVFGRADIQAALAYSFERPPAHVGAYLEENFQLAEASDEAGEHSAGEAPALPPGPGVEPDDETADAGRAGDAQGRRTATDEGQEEAQPDPEHGVDGVAPGDAGDPSQPQRRPPAPARPSIIERFAAAQGFHKSIDGRYFHADGAWIGRADGVRSLWERWTASGELVRYYWPRDHCLEREPLQLDADIWGLIDQNPETYALILANAEDAAVEVTGTRLRAMRDDGELTLFPASYRLVVDSERRR